MKYYILLVITIFFFNQRGISSEGEKQYPNIIIILTDDLGYGDVSCYNPESKIQTPFIDQLALEGMRFTDAHSSCGVCSPSRYALLTGRFHWRKINGIAFPFDPPFIDEDEPTIARFLREKGYETACIGKWHLGWNWNWKNGVRPADSLIRYRGISVATTDLFDLNSPVTGGAMGAGFDYYFGQDVPNFPPYAWMENGMFLNKNLVDICPEDLHSIGERGSIHGCGPGEKGWDLSQVMPVLTERTISYIQKRNESKKPFFLYFSTTSPHTPVVPTKEFHGESQAEYYGDYVIQTDNAIGKIIKVLKRTGLYENTILIVSSDNGPEWHAYDRFCRTGHWSSGALRGLKRDLYEGGHRIPLIISWPGHIQAGTVNNELISQIDLYATLAKIAGHNLSPGEAEDSYNILPVLEGKEKSPRKNIIYNTRKNVYAIRSEEWVLIAAESGSQSNVTECYRNYEKENGYLTNEYKGELYNLNRDLIEKNNLYAKKPKKVEKLSGILRDLLHDGQVR